jgi:hypothetical protein
MNDTNSGKPVTGVAQYRYGSQMAGIKGGCPKDATSDFDETCFRAVHGDPKTDSYLPHAVLDSTRYGKGCCDWGLSMYDSLDHLKARFKHVMKIAPNFLKRVGDQYAELGVAATHGRRTKANSGHFTFFEFDTFNANTCVKSTGPLGL